MGDKGKKSVGTADAQKTARADSSNTHQALYRTYRSRNLSEVVGQSHVTEILAAQLSAKEPAHAYLLTGPRGIGKTSVARIIARAVNDLPDDAVDENLDIIEIDAASNTGVDNIRDLRDKISIAPAHAKYKVYIIDEVHMLSTGAFNALLKTLEEPPAHAIFVLATTEVQKVPATILSRVQRFHFRPISTTDAVAHLKMIADKEEISADDDALELIARRGDGSMRDSITILDQLRGAKKVTRELVEATLGLASNDQIDLLASSVAHGDIKKTMETLEKFRQEGVAPAIIVDQLISKLSDQAGENPRLFTLIERLIDVSKSADPELKLAAILASFASESSGASSIAVAAPMAEIVAEAPAKDLKKTTSERNLPKIADDDPVMTQDGEWKEEEKEDPEKKPGSKDTTAPKEVKAASLKTKQVTADKSADKDEKTSAKDSIPAPAEIDWSAVIADLRKHNPPLASVVKLAEFDYTAPHLTIYFKNKLPRKKLADARYKTIFASTLATVCPGVEFMVADNAKPRIAADKTAVDQITAIMGGGELM